MVRGKLRFEDDHNGRRLRVVPEDGSKVRNVPPGQLDRRLREQWERDAPALDGTDVEYDLRKGGVKDVRPAGEEIQRRPPPREQPGAKPPRAFDRPAGEFHNPYNFVPTMERPTEAAELGVGPPEGLHRFHDDRYVATLRVRLTAVAPLLIPDAARATEDRNGHVTMPLRVGPDGRPLLSATSVKGALRSAYEAVTNSRLSVFTGHEERLGYRTQASQGAGMVPVRIVEAAGGGLAAQLLRGVTGRSGPDGRPASGEPLYAAWLPRYHHGRLGGQAVRYPDGTLPEHGDRVKGWARRRSKDRRYHYVQIESLARFDEELPARPSGDVVKIEDGWVVITNPSISRKHDEKVFFSASPPEEAPLSDEHLDAWRTLIAEYQELHRDEIEKRRQRQGAGPEAYLGREPGKTAFSRHVYDSSYRELAAGMFCYAAVSKGKIAGLYPVQIPRRLNDAPPEALLDPAFRPATQLDELSPAERLFGWVSQDGEGAYRGRVRVGAVRCCTEAEEAIERFDRWFDAQPGLPLGILSTPKPHQARFYVGRRSERGAVEAQDPGLPREEVGYDSPATKSLRGRKVYPHHRGRTGDYWTPNEKGRADGVHQEYWRREPKDGSARDDQNRSVLGWVKPGTVFELDLRVEDVSLTELGGLAWLLDLNRGLEAGQPERHLRIGGGKPLGFGSVLAELVLDECEVVTGAELADGIRNLAADRYQGAAAPGEMLESARQSFAEELARLYRAPSVEEVPFVEAFLQAATGFDDGLPVHYPRPTAHPDPEGNSYEWFVANERVRRNEEPTHYSLPDLAGDPGLPRQGG